jgi:hypothetical protein
MKKYLIAALAAAFVSPAFAASQPEPFAGDVVNQSQFRVLIWGDNAAGSGTGVSYGCVNANTSTHNWSWGNDIDFVYSVNRGEWCKIGTGEARIGTGGVWTCPGGWSRPNYLRYDLRC